MIRNFLIISRYEQNRNIVWMQCRSHIFYFHSVFSRLFAVAIVYLACFPLLLSQLLSVRLRSTSAVYIIITYPQPQSNKGWVYFSDVVAAVHTMLNSCCVREVKLSVGTIYETNKNEKNTLIKRHARNGCVFFYHVWSAGHWTQFARARRYSIVMDPLLTDKYLSLVVHRWKCHTKSTLKIVTIKYVQTMQPY